MKRTWLLVLIAAGAALIFAAVATSTIGIAPAFNMGLVSGVVCPAGQRLEYTELGQFTDTDADGTHNRANVSFACVAVDGTRTEGHGTATIAALTGLYFLLLFVPLLVAIFVLRQRMRRRSPARPPTKPRP